MKTLLTIEEQKNLDMVDYAIIDKSGEVVWVLSEKGKEFIFSDFDPNYEDKYTVNNVPFERYSHYISLPDKDEKLYEAFAWYGPHDSYVDCFYSAENAIDWLVRKD